MRHRIVQVTFGVVSVLAFGLMAAPAAASSRTLVTPAGDLLVVTPAGARGMSAPTALRVTRYRTAAPPQTAIVPGTEDAAFDAFPTLVLDPESQAATLVWSHHNGTDYDLMMSRLEGDAWSRPIVLVGTPQDEIRPDAYPAPGLGIHLFWSTPGDRRGFHYALFRADSGTLLRGPERLAVVLPPSPGPGPEGTVDDPGQHVHGDVQDRFGGGDREPRPRVRPGHRGLSDDTGGTRCRRSLRTPLGARRAGDRGVRLEPGREPVVERTLSAGCRAGAARRGACRAREAALHLLPAVEALHSLGTAGARASPSLSGTGNRRGGRRRGTAAAGTASEARPTARGASTHASARDSRSASPQRGPRRRCSSRRR
jgi:hypothetical protein